MTPDRILRFSIGLTIGWLLAVALYNLTLGDLP